MAGSALDQDAKSCGTVLGLVRDACPSNGSLPRRITRWGPFCLRARGECVHACEEWWPLMRLRMLSRVSAWTTLSRLRWAV